MVLGVLKDLKLFELGKPLLKGMFETDPLSFWGSCP
jgi:hypothetical protein